jgi:hypothetical protein
LLITAGFGKISFFRIKDMKPAGYGRQRRYVNIASTYIDVAPAIAPNKIMVVDRETVKRQL